jgi:hypothetical protein
MKNWKTSTKQIFYGILLYVVAGIFAGVILPLNAFFAVAEFAAAHTVNIVAMAWIARLLNVAMIGGLLIAFIGALDWGKIVDDADKKNVNKLKIAFILQMIALVTGLFWVLGQDILTLVAFFLMLFAYKGFMKSESFSKSAKKAGKQLYTSCLLLILATAVSLSLGWIPLVGMVFKSFAGVLSIVAFVLIFIGWYRMKSTDIKQ